MKKILQLVVTLSVICAICAGVLALVNLKTKDAIREVADEKSRAAVRAVMPPEAVALESLGGDVYVGKDEKGAVVGYAAQGRDSGGYGGDIELMAGFRADGRTLVGYRTLVAAETPGLGMKLKTPEFTTQFAGKDARTLKVRKDGGEIEAITSATITSRAVCRALADAQSKVAAAREVR